MTRGGHSPEDIQHSLRAIREAVEEAGSQDTRRELGENYQTCVDLCDEALELLHRSGPTPELQALLQRLLRTVDDSLPWTPTLLTRIQGHTDLLRSVGHSVAVGPPWKERAHDAFPSPGADRGSEGPPLPLSYDAALLLARRAFGGAVVLEDHTVERSWGWVFSATSSRHAETGDIGDALCGLGPVIVDRLDGSVHSRSSGAPANAWADDYERKRFRRTWRETIGAGLRRVFRRR